MESSEIMKRLLAALTLFLLPTAMLAAELTDQERRGRDLYFQGISSTGAEVVALIGNARTEVPATALPCAGCHGPDGHGRPQGALSPADLTWPALSEPGRTNGRQRPPYTETLLKRAITQGLDAAGNRLHVTMPRYRLTTRDADDLIAFIRQLGTDPDSDLGTD